MNYLLPDNASTFATPFDQFAIFMLVLCGLTTFFIFITIFIFVVKYHRHKGPAEELRQMHWLEYAWTVIPFGIFVFIFWWGTRVYLQIESVPATGLPVFALGKQWMWEFEHSSGRKEINELHLPVGRAVRVTMISQDVIHSFFVPAFRVKQDVLPGRYTYVWFTPTQIGRYRILCAEMCGSNHSEMTGFVNVMSADDYAKWLGSNQPTSLVEQGRELFQNRQCVSCHSEVGRAPSLEGILGKQELLSDGSRAKVDENYLMESILRPSAKVTKGYGDVMPSYQGQLSDQEVKALVEFIKTLTEPTP